MAHRRQINWDAFWKHTVRETVRCPRCQRPLKVLALYAGLHPVVGRYTGKVVQGCGCKPEKAER